MLKILPIFTRSELIVLAAALSALTVFIVMALNGRQTVHWSGFLIPYGFSVLVVSCGLLYRTSNRSRELGMVLVNTGLFVLFTSSLAPLNYMIYPTGTGGIDPLLMQLDALIGFDWEAFVHWFVPYPRTSALLGILYQTSLIQILLVIIYLGLTGDSLRLERLILIGCFCSCFSLIFWSIWPSFGPTQIVRIPEDVMKSLGLLVDADYSAHLTSVRNGEIMELEPRALKGLIAFPSMHLVFLLLCVVGTAGTRAFPYFLVLNIPMPVSILLHGGHHLFDLFGGAAVYGLSYLLAIRLQAPATLRIGARS